MATRHRTIGRHGAGFGFVVQRFFLHVAKVSTALDVAGLAPTRTVAQTGIVVHLDRTPGGLAGMAGHAIK